MTETENESAQKESVAAPENRSSWERLRAIIDSLADGIVIVDQGGDIRFANPAAARLFNRAAEDLIGTAFGSPLLAGETTEMEIVRRGGGDVVYAELRVVDTEWEGDTADLVSLRDVTDRRQAEERTRQLAHEREARLEAEASSQAKSDFLAIMSHELRTPLNAILGYSELMELGISGDLTDQMRKQVGRIRVSAKHLLGLVNDILDLAKVEAGRLSVANASASVEEAITSAMTLTQPQAEARNLELVVIPGGRPLPSYVGDDERVRQILVNLLSNAIKCTEPGGTITIESSQTAKPDDGARLQPRTSYLRVKVADTGQGIPEEKLGAIFEPFVQGDTGPTRSQEGTGLGLTIGRRLARLMGGDLTVKSEVGEGSTFALWLPVDCAALEAAAEESETEAQGPSDARQISADVIERQLEGLSEVGTSILAQLEPTVATIVGRIRSDPAIRMAAGLRSSQVADHLSTFLADIASALAVVEESSGKPSPLLADTMEIQRLVSERHGAQRGRLGWTEAAIRREFMIIREEIEGVVRKAVPAGGALAASDAIATVNRFLDQAEYVTVRALEREIQE
ncbi:MAG: sensor histidine kinase [Gemmatimonadaceae bacterium]